MNGLEILVDIEREFVIDILKCCDLYYCIVS